MKTILVIDNYDSFTYNLVQYFGEVGQDTELVIWRNDQFTLHDIDILKPSGIVVSPGPCTPLEAGLSVSVIQNLAPYYPIFGVCLGHQSIGQAFGASVVRHKIIVHGKTDQIQHNSTGVFANLPQPMTATRYHSLVVENLPEQLVANAWVDEPYQGGSIRTIMGLHHAQYPTHGVQFHPESVLTDGGKTMISNFLSLT